MKPLKIATALSAVLTLAACATPVIENPRWSRIPDADDMADVYPIFASQVDLEGAARLSCVAQEDGVLADCRVVEASPPGLGFDRAALQLTPRFLVSPRQQDGVSQKARVTFNLRFRLPADEEAPPPWTGPQPDAATIDRLRSMATFMFEGLLSEQAADAPDVDQDRVAFVQTLFTTAAEDLREEWITATALALARILTPEQVEAAAARRRPPGVWPTEEQMTAASDRLHEVDMELSRRVRAGYCARYECTDKIPTRSEPVNRTGAVGQTG